MLGGAFSAVVSPRTGTGNSPAAGTAGGGEGPLIFPVFGMADHLKMSGSRIVRLSEDDLGYVDSDRPLLV